MPTLADPIADERFEDIVAELRASRPVAPDPLRRRVRTSAVAPASAPRRLGGAARVLVPALVVALAASIGVLGARTIETGGGAAGDEAASGEAASATVPGDVPELTRTLAPYSADGEALRSPAPASAQAFAPSSTPGRLQEQRIELGVRVRDVDALSEATAEAMAIARSLGGYVVAAHYDVPTAESGESTLVVRVPVGRVQEAIARFTDLGTIASQDVQLQDLQAAFDRRTREIRGLRERIARLQAELAGPDLTDEERVRLQAQLAAARRGLESRLAQQRAAEQRGRLARVALTLTTQELKGPQEEPGEVEATLRGAAGLLQAILVWTLAALIVASPFLLLALLAATAARLRRRQLDARLLERA